MSLYIPSHFAARDGADIRALIGGYPFATLITTTTTEPHITHLPLLLEGDALVGHMARANPHWQYFDVGATIAVFHGPHAYISPAWYVEPDRNVPTWNYATVHVLGKPLLMGVAADKLALLDRSVDEFERTNSQPWTRKIEGPKLQGMLDAIVAFRMPLTRVEAKFKMNQNRTPADRAQVIDRLRDSGHFDLQAMADWMQTHEHAQ
jgi:transcriptional regulator